MKLLVCIASAADTESKSWQCVEIVPVNYMVEMLKVYISMFLCNYSGQFDDVGDHIVGEQKKIIYVNMKNGSL